MSSSNRTDITVDHHDLFKALFESSPILMAMLDPQLNYIQVNHAYAEADEKEPSFFSGKNHFDLYPNDENRQVFRKVVDNGQPYQNQTKPFKNERNKERGVTWWDWSLVPVKDDSGRVTALILSLVDVTKQKRAEKELRQSEWRFDLVVQATSDGIWEWNIVTNEEYFAPRWCEIIGYSHDDPELPHTYDSWAARIHPDDHERVMQVMKAHLEAGEIYDVDYRHRHKSGEYRWQNSCGQAVFDDHGKPVRMVGCIRDITERKKAEEALAHNEERFKRLFQLAPLGYQSLDENGDYLEVNDAWCRTLGYSRDEVIGHNFGEFIDPDFRDIYQRCFPKFKNEGLLEGVELTMIKKDGARIIASFVGRVGYNDDGSFKQTHCIFVDITERKKADEALRESEDSLKDAQSIANMGSWSWDLKTNDITWSDNLCVLHGLKPGEFDGQLDTVMSLIHPDDVALVQEKTQQLLEGKEPIEFEYRILPKNGVERVVRGGQRLHLDKDGNVVRMSGFLQDITEQRLAEEALRESEEKHRGLTENLPQRIFHKDANLVYVSCNEHFARDLGFAPNEITSKTDFDLYPRELAEKYREEDRRLMASGQTEEIEESSIKEGQEVFVQTVKTLLTDDSGNVTGILGIFWDITARKKAEEALQVSERRFRTAITEAPVPIMIHADDGQVLHISKVWTEITGYKHSDIPTIDDWTSKAYGQKMDNVKGYLDTIFDRGVVAHDGEFVITTKTGATRIWDFSSGPNGVLSDGRRLVISMATDITERKQAEEALRESEEKYRTMFESMAQGVFYQRADATLIDANSAALEMFGLDRDQFLGKTSKHPSWKVIHEDGSDFPGEEHPSMIALRTGSPVAGVVAGVFNPLKKDYVWLNINAIPQFKPGGDRPYQVFVTLHDITERKQAEEALRASEEKFRTYISHAPDAIFIADPQGRYVDVNEAACRLTGYSREELTSMSITDLTDPEHISEARARFENFKETGSLSTESRFRRKDGSIVCVSLDAVVLSEGVFMAFCSDITETKRLRELESRAQRLETAGQIAGQVAHDFNNLLAPLMAYPEFIRDELGPDHSALQYLDDIENAAQQIADINQQLLTLGRRGHYNQEPMNLNEVVSQAIRQMESLPSTLVVASKLDEDLMNIKGGRSQIFRAISNLLSNAREAMQDIGQITVRTENFYVDEMWINYARVPQGEYVKLTISDTGCGIPDEIKQKIFEPFFTTKTTDKKRGSGLGISVVDAVIKDHEGHIDVASVMGEGTSFFLYFPVTRDSINTPLHHEIVGGRGSILIVDDDKVQRDVCTKLLNSLGYQSTVVGSGEEALKALGDQRYDLLILDMIMPLGIDGAETFRQTLLINPDQKAIIVSGFAESDRVAAALKMGAGAFVKKPLTRRRLAVAVRDEFDRVVHPA